MPRPKPLSQAKSLLCTSKSLTISQILLSYNNYRKITRISWSRAQANSLFAETTFSSEYQYTIKMNSPMAQKSLIFRPKSHSIRFSLANLIPRSRSKTKIKLALNHQDDPELATGFIESDGLDCLMRVAVGADQIHQNYILRGE